MDAIKLQSRIISKISTALNEFHRTELDPQKLLNLSKQLSKICSVYYSSEHPLQTKTMCSILSVVGLKSKRVPAVYF